MGQYNMLKEMWELSLDMYA